MTETKRTTVTLSKIYMNMVDELVGVFGRTEAAVINNIVQHFFNNKNNFPLLEELRKRKKTKPNKLVLEEKIKELFLGVQSIKLEHFLDYLGITRNYFIENLKEWKEKFNIILDYDRVVITK